MNLLKLSVILVIALGANVSFATPKVQCVDVVGDENAVLAEASLISNRATLQFKDRISFDEQLEAIFNSYIVDVEKQSEGQYRMTYSLKFSSGLVLMVETKVVRPNEPMMIADFVDALAGVGDEQAADCWVTE